MLVPDTFLRPIISFYRAVPKPLPGNPALLGCSSCRFAALMLARGRPFSTKMPDATHYRYRVLLFLYLFTASVLLRFRFGFQRPPVLLFVWGSASGPVLVAQSARGGRTACGGGSRDPQANHRDRKLAAQSVVVHNLMPRYGADPPQQYSHEWNRK